MKRLLVFLCTASINAAAWPSIAQSDINIWDRCLSAARAGASDRVTKYANYMINSPSIAERDVELSELCVSAARSELVVYDKENGAFVPAIEFAKLAATRLNIKTGGNSATLSSLIAASEANARHEADRWTRDRQVQARTVDACNALYERDWVAAMTSQICQPIFTETGLPD